MISVWQITPLGTQKTAEDENPKKYESVTVAILAQGTSWAVAVTQAFLLAGSILVKCACAWPGLDRTNSGLGAQLSVLSGPAGASKCHPVHFPGCVGS